MLSWLEKASRSVPQNCPNAGRGRVIWQPQDVSLQYNSARLQQFQSPCLLAWDDHSPPLP